MRKLQEPQSASLSSLTNERTRSLHLYVMQNEHGAIKLGRSSNPESRRKQLQYQVRCKISLVATFEQSGHMEEWLHFQLKEFRIEQEWFTGTDGARVAMERLLHSTLAWPFKHSATAESEWLRILAAVQGAHYWQKRERRTLCNLTAARDGFGRFKGMDGGHSMLDARLSTLLGYAQPCVEHDGTVRGFCEETQTWMPVPSYTRDITAAESLWDTGALRRTVTTPIDCCLAALCDLWGFAEDKLTPLDTW